MALEKQHQSAMDALMRNSDEEANKLIEKLGENLNMINKAPEK